VAKVTMGMVSAKSEAGQKSQNVSLKMREFIF
jgi:hypothetical protein